MGRPGSATRQGTWDTGGRQASYNFLGVWAPRVQCALIGSDVRIYSRLTREARKTPNSALARRTGSQVEWDHAEQTSDMDNSGGGSQ